MFQQYVRLAPNHDEAQRREELSLIASAVVEKLENGNWDPERLASELVTAASGRHLMLWSTHPDEQAGWTAVQIAGTLKPNSMLLGVHNRGGNKLDQFLGVNASVVTRGVRDGTRVTVTVRLHNAAPTKEDLPPKVAGPYPGAVDGAEGRYQGLLVMQLPGDAAERHDRRGRSAGGGRTRRRQPGRRRVRATRPRRRRAADDQLRAPGP